MNFDENIFREKRGYTATATFLALGLAIIPCHGANYYVSASGLDTNPGTSPGFAWKTIARANIQSLKPGDQLLFQGGGTFNGTIYFGASAGGTEANPLLVSSFGTGRATINGLNTNAFFAYNCAGIVISNLNFIGSGFKTNRNSGVEFFNDGGGSSQILSFIRINEVDVGGFGFSGISIGGYSGTNGYTDVRVVNADAHDNTTAGILTYAQYPNLNTNIYVGYCRAWNNPGSTNHSGDGIVIGEASDALVERCQTWTNGWLANGSVGIRTYDSARVTIQFCESHHNRTLGINDGGGFDFDGGMTSSVMQYNYSHDDNGAGLSVYQYAGSAGQSNNVIRFNISQNDGRSNSHSGLQFWNGVAGTGILDVYNNTIFVSPATTGTPRAVYFRSAVSNVRLRNNLFVTTGGARLIEGPSGQSGVVFQGNDYWPSGGTFVIKWGGTTYSTLDTWRTGSGMERIGTTNVGFSVDPQLMNPGGGTTIGNADLLSALTAYQLQTYSPMCEAGLNLPALFGINIGTMDYYGNTVPNGLTFDVGAHDSQLYLDLISPGIVSGHFNASYVRSSPPRTDLVYAIQLSTDFTNWCEACAVPTQTNALGNGTEMITLRDTSPVNGAGPRFIRLRAARVL
jgi:hypothetical protein